MDNSSRIESATRNFVGASLTGEQIKHLVAKAHPTWKGGVYPSDVAYAKMPNGTFAPRGKQSYGDGVLEYKGSDSFLVLPTEKIVRRARQTGRGSNAPKSAAEIDAELQTIAKALAQGKADGQATAKVGDKAGKQTPASA